MSFHAVIEHLKEESVAVDTLPPSTAPDPFEGASRWNFLVPLLVGLLTAWPICAAAWLFGSAAILRTLIGDSYHYLAIARKALASGIYTYDGVHVTNGFHPLWEYTLRLVFTGFHLQTHEAQGVAVVILGLASVTAGAMLTSAAILRITRQPFLGCLVVPGLFYMIVGVHAQTNSIWSTIIGMESSFSMLFGGLFFFVLSFYLGASASQIQDDWMKLFRALGLLLPFLVLSRLDDVFLLPAFLIACLLLPVSRARQVVAALWIALPTTVALVGYLGYNLHTVGAAMPLSGATKSGFVGLLTAYLTAGIHFPPLLDLHDLHLHRPLEGATTLAGSFRFIEVAYPMLLAAFGALALWRYRRRHHDFAPLFALCLYIVFKMGFNFMMVHPWHQAAWYYAFAILTLSVLGALALAEPWRRLQPLPIVRAGIVTVYAGLTMLAAAQSYATIVYRTPEQLEDRFWLTHAEVRRQLLAHGVTGIINEDDGITAFLLDLPMLHGFAFATDVEAQRAFTAGHLLTLAETRHINTLAGFGYLATTTPPATDAEIRDFLAHSLAEPGIRADLNDFDFSLAYYDPALKLPFFRFQHR